MLQMFDLTGRNALVIGAAGGLGGAAARALSKAGASVISADLPDNESQSRDAEAGRETTGLFPCDVSSEKSVLSLFATADTLFEGRYDIMVNASGVMLRKPFDLTSVEEFQRVLSVNLTGAWLVATEAGKRMKAQGSGRIITFSSVYAERVGPIPESAYYASKAGLANLTRGLAAELGPYGVGVNCVAPGLFYPTGMTSALGSDSERMDWFVDKTMLRRLGDPAQDIDGPVLFLASDASRYVTGQILYVDGGWTAW